ncbi:MAG TPA: DUF58 domain-containing protein [Candidatus Limnocylindria bacterium]|jgi:uncharacterized protein (DUF58 family)|nr:DUF58 domain-containing protein [Candidatus Limnocylindria bacterium]
MGGLGRQLRFVFLGTVLVVAAFSTGINFLFFLVYLLGGLLIAAWLYARRALNGLRAGYQVANPRAQVGDTLRATYRIDNANSFGKPWVELWNDSTLPTPMPGRAIGVQGHGSRQWLAKVPLQRRGSYRLGALRVRAGDPFGLFSSEMVVGQPTWIVVFPRVHALPHWRLPPTPVDGTAPSRRRFEAASPLVSSIRPYVHGDAINRIHWLTSVRHGELHVKEFDVEQTADLWILLDLDRSAHAGAGDGASVETAVSAAASIAVQTLIENRAVGITVSSRRQHVLTPDRGTRVEQKILHLLANVQADGNRPLAEVLVAILPQLRRGMTLCIITGSTDREWVRALASLRRRGVGTVVVLLDRESFAARHDDEAAATLGAIRHALAEYDIDYHLVHAGDSLPDALGGKGAGRRASLPKILSQEELRA